MVGRAGAPGAGAGAPPPRPKKQNHANIPCPIENCARFTYGKLPDHLTKRHGLTGAERDAVNERQRKRFFNGELCQVRFLKEAAIRDLWGADYDDPRIRAKIHDTYAMVKIRIIPLAATARARPLTEQDANVLTNYNARTEGRARRRVAAPLASSSTAAPPRKRAKSCEWSEGDENLSGRSSDLASLSPSPPGSPHSESPSRLPSSSPLSAVASPRLLSSSPRSESETESPRSSPLVVLPPTPPPSAHASPGPPPTNAVDARLHDILDSKIDEGYKFVIDDMKKSMTVGRSLAPRKRKMYRTYRRYARRLISFLQRQHSPLAYDVDLLLCSEPHVAAFLERVRAHFKPKTVRNYIVAAIKLLDSRLFALETEPTCREKAASMSRLYDALHRRLRACESMLPHKASAAPTPPPPPPSPPHAPLLSPASHHLTHPFDPASYLPLYEVSSYIS